MKTLILMIVFAFLNRVRGGGMKPVWNKLDFVARILAGAVIGFLIYSQSQSLWAFPICIALYMIGESFGWGKWIATALDCKQRINENEGYSPGLDMWDGIHHLADSIIPEEKNPIGYSRVALVIRGLYWWVLIFLYAALMGVTGWGVGMLGIAALSVCFPLSLWLSQQTGFHVPFLMPGYAKASYSDKDWAEAEIIYGAIQGLALALLLGG